MSIQKAVLEYIDAEGSNIDADTIVEYVISLTKSYNSALVQLSGIRQLLKANQLADDILRSPSYRDLLSLAKTEAEEALEDGVDKKDRTDKAVMERLGDYNAIYRDLLRIVDDLEEGTRQVNIRDLIYAIINFAARPIDILQMKFKGDNLVNWGKQRHTTPSHTTEDTQQAEAPYLGFLQLPDAKYLLHRVQLKYSKLDRPSVMRELHRATNAILGCNPRDLRRISSIILSSTEPNRIKRIKKQQAILRHKKPITSVMYYS